MSPPCFAARHPFAAMNHTAGFVVSAFLIALGIYLASGLVFAVPFVLSGVKRIDPHAAHGSWSFKLLIIPGTIAFWPLLLRRWLKGNGNPPEERNAHRLSASSSEPSAVTGWGRPVPTSTNPTSR
jgi:hypothetical protein